MEKYYEDVKNVIENDELLAGGEIPVLTANVTIKSAEALKRGTLLSLNEDGTVEPTTKGKTAEYVLQNEIETVEGGKQVGTVYESGRFHREKIKVADDDSVEAHEQELRMKNIHMTSLK